MKISFPNSYSIKKLKYLCDLLSPILIPSNAYFSSQITWEANAYSVLSEDIMKSLSLSQYIFSMLKNIIKSRNHAFFNHCCFIECFLAPWGSQWARAACLRRCAGARPLTLLQVTSDNLAHFIDTTVFLEILNGLLHAPPNHYLELYWTQ